MSSEAGELNGGLDVSEGTIGVPGGDVWYKIVGASRPEIPLVALHGGPGYPSTDLYPLEALGSERPIILYDQLGCGNSMLPEQDTTDYSHLWTVDRFVEELVAVRNGLGLEEMHLLGLSWGGSLALEYMVQKKPEGVRSLVLSSPLVSTSLFVSEIVEVARGLGDSAAKTLKEHAVQGDTENAEYVELLHEFETRYIIGREVEDFPDDQRQALEASEERFGRQVSDVMMGKSEFHPTGPLANYERVGQLKQLGHLPVLYTSGKDDYITPGSVEGFHRATPGSEFVLFENSAHMAHFTETGRYLQRVSAFLRRAEAQPA